MAKEFKTVLSRYADSLENRTKKRYIEKISVIGIDPLVIPQQKYFLLLKLVISYRTSCSRPVPTRRICLKFSGVFWRIVIWCPGLSQVFLDKLFEKNTLFKIAKVRHSQRMNDPRMQLFIITTKQGSVVLGHSAGCMAGLGECRPHIASVLFTSKSGRE